MAKSRASKGLLLSPRTIPNESAARRTKWLVDAETNFITSSPANRRYYAILLQALWPEGHGIPGPILSQNDLRAAIDEQRSAQGESPYKDVFRRVRELQGEEGFTSIVKEGIRYQLQSLEMSQKREPRSKLSAKDWRTLKERYGFRCSCCGKSEPEIKLSPDHKIPRSRNGSNELGNYQPLCEQCNNIKSNICSGCNLLCNVCSWAFPQDYKQLIIEDNNKELIRRESENRKIPQSDLVNMVLRDYFNRTKR
jgi:5-methylcytosine-specific restriction endonuclease McrA